MKICTPSFKVNKKKIGKSLAGVHIFYPTVRYTSSCP